MVDVNRLLPLVRMAVFGFVSLLGLIVFALACHIVHVLNEAGATAAFAGLSLATGLFTILSLPPLLFISLTRKGAVANYVATEIAWLWFLWIMWIASAGSTAAIGVSGSGGLVSEVQVIEAFGFINWLALMFYTTALLVLAIIAHLKGSGGVWTAGAAEFDFNGALAKTRGAPAPGVVGAYAAPYSMEQQHQTTAPQFSGEMQHQTTAPQFTGDMQPVQPPMQQQQQYVGYAGQPMGAAPSAAHV